MTHKGCGGEIFQDKSVLYEYGREDGSVEKIPALRCRKCGNEITGDPQIEDDGVYQSVAKSDLLGLIKGE